jgi:hypothetical protein
MELITPPDSVVPVYRIELDAKQVANDEKERARLAAEEKAQHDVRASAVAKLAALGLTKAEVEALLGL